MEPFKAEGATYRVLQVEKSRAKLDFKVVGYGVARYNSAIAYQGHFLVSCTSYLKLLDIPNRKELYARQIGNSQITQIDRNKDYVMVVNFEGLVTLLNANDLNKVEHQFQAAGKEVRHTCINEEFLASSSELIAGSDEAILEVFSLEKIREGNYKPVFEARGYFYFPEVSADEMVVLQYHNPNPKGKSRKDTVLEKKLPITNSLVHFRNFKKEVEIKIPHYCEVICAVRNGSTVFYLHNDKFITVYDMVARKLYEYNSTTLKSMLMCVEKYKQGAIFVSGSNKLTYIYLSDGKLLEEHIDLKSPAICSNLCIKFNEDQGIFGFNENGLHYYDVSSKKTSSIKQFDITNCGLVASPDGKLFAAGDFTGNVCVYPTEYLTEEFEPLFRACVVMPVRALAWVASSNTIAIGTTEGTLYAWNYETSTQPTVIYQFPHSINCMKADRGMIMVGTSHGDIALFDENDYSKSFDHKAHHPIHYECPIQREMFGSLKHYAEIWSLTSCPKESPDFLIASSSEDQTKKIFRVDKQKQTLDEIAHLRGHELATTSIDWKLMRKDIGQVFVSCSDDKRTIFRLPKRNFEVFAHIETTTIREWHTLTYLALEEGGSRVAIGSQNGYLFIYDIKKQRFEYAEKIHLGGVEGLVWSGNKIITCSSDLALNIITVSPAEQ